MEASSPQSDTPRSDPTSLHRFESNFANLDSKEYGEFVSAAFPGILALLRASYGHLLADTELRDVAQQVFARAWIKRDKFTPGQADDTDPDGDPAKPRPKRSLWGWLWGIAGHLAIDALRIKSKSPAQFAQAYDPPAPPTQDPDESERRPLTPAERTVRRFIESLSTKDRRIVEGAMSGSRSWTIRLASDLGIRPGAVRLRWMRIRRRLAAELERGSDVREEGANDA